MFLPYTPHLLILRRVGLKEVQEVFLKLSWFRICRAPCRLVSDTLSCQNIMSLTPGKPSGRVCWVRSSTRTKSAMIRSKVKAIPYRKYFCFGDLQGESRLLLFCPMFVSDSTRSQVQSIEPAVKNQGLIIEIGTRRLIGTNDRRSFL